MRFFIIIQWIIKVYFFYFWGTFPLKLHIPIKLNFTIFFLHPARLRFLMLKREILHKRFIQDLDCIWQLNERHVHLQCSQKLPWMHGDGTLYQAPNISNGEVGRIEWNGSCEVSYIYKVWSILRKKADSWHNWFI